MWPVATGVVVRSLGRVLCIACACLLPAGALPVAQPGAEVAPASLPGEAAGGPAAVFVITSEMIRRSGATSIMDALRMAPGLEVAQINSNTWAITSRGFNHANAAPGFDPTGTGDDAWRQGRFGFRADWEPDRYKSNTFTMLGTDVPRGVYGTLTWRR